MPGSVRFRYTDTQRLTGSEVEALWQLYQRTFDAERRTFTAAVEEADEVLRFHDARSGALVGMTLVRAWPTEHEGRSVRMLWTGAVCIEPAYRGRNAVQQSGLWRLARERLRHPLSEVWWFWDTFSIKSYLMCPRNLAQYTPKRGEVPGRWEQGLLDRLCRSHAGDAYDAQARVLRSTGKKLRPGVADLPPDHPDVHAQFFLEQNPGHAEGDRLPVLVPLNARNVRAIVGASVRRATRGRRRSPKLSGDAGPGFSSRPPGAAPRPPPVG
jgi:hypothetical protein